MRAQSVELPTQLSVPDPSRSSIIVIIGQARMMVQRRGNGRGLASDRDPQPGDLRDNVGLSVDPQSRIVSPHRTRVKPSAAE
jgi:hypothetical protein